MIIEQTEQTAVEVKVAEALTQLETRFAMVRDALINDRGHVEEAATRFIDAMTPVFDSYRIDAREAVTLDDLVLRVLGEMKPCRDRFFEFVQLVCDSSRGPALHDMIRAFLGRSLALKYAPRDIIHFNHLWCDHYRFALREFFLGTIALLLRAQQYEEVARYLAADYRFETDRGSQITNFLSFDAYIKSLDEFRTRRLRLNRLSVAADVLRDRADLSFLAFDDVMQADFLLCVRGLLHHPKALTRWFPRTLVYAERYEKAGFDLFFTAQSKQHFASVATVLGVRSKSDLKQRFEQVYDDCALDQWKFGGCPIPFDRYMGMAALDTA